MSSASLSTSSQKKSNRRHKYAINPNFHPAQIVIEWSFNSWYGGLELWGNTGRLDAPVGTNSSGDDVPGVINSRGNLRCAAIAGSGDRDRDDDDDDDDDD